MSVLYVQRMALEKGAATPNKLRHQLLTISTQSSSTISAYLSTPRPSSTRHLSTIATSKKLRVSACAKKDPSPHLALRQYHTSTPLASPASPVPSDRKTPNIVRITKREPSRLRPDPQTADVVALRTAEAREASLRAARLRREDERRDQAAEDEKKELAKKDYEERYKSTSRKWISSIIAMPILLVTSYYLFDRLYIGTLKKEMPRL